jgi:hypothetical protein
LRCFTFSFWSFELYEEGAISANITPLFRLLVLAGVVGAGITIVDMEYFLFRFDTSHPLKQILWFVIMLIPLVGRGPVRFCCVFAVRSTEAGLQPRSGPSH